MNKQIEDLQAATQVNLTDLIVLKQAGQTEAKKATTEQLLNYLFSLINLDISMIATAFQGVATPTTDPAPITSVVDSAFWITAEAGVYADFDGVVVPVESFAVIAWAGGNFQVSSVSLSALNVVKEDVDAVNMINDAYLTTGYVGSGGNVNSDDVAWKRTKEIYIEKSQTYVFKANNFNVTASKNLNFYSDDLGFISNIKINAIPFEFTAPANADFFLANMQEDTDVTTPSALSLTLKTETKLAVKIDGAFLAAANIIVNSSTKKAAEKLLVSSSGVAIEKSYNLFDNSKITVGYVSGGGALDNGDTDWKKVLITGLKPDTVYTISEDVGGVFFPSLNKNIVFFDENGGFIRRTRAATNPASFVTPSNVAYTYMNVAYVGDGDNIANIETANFMINEGGVREVVYKPYQLGVLSDIFGYKVLAANTVQSMTYAQLKTSMSLSQLTTGQRLLITSAPNGLVILVDAISSSSVSKNIVVLNLPEEFDFYELDVVNDVIKAFDNLSCVIRISGGNWAYINDADHVPKGFDTISQNADSVTVNYKKTYTKVLSLLATPDETYTQFGIFGVGSSVGLGFSIIKLSCEGLVGEVGEVSATLEIVNAGFQAALKSVNMSGGGLITIVHGQTVGLIAVINSLNPSHYYKVISTISLTQTTLECYDIATNTKITSPVGLSFVFSRAGGRLIRTNEAEIAAANIWVSGQMMTEFS